MTRRRWVIGMDGGGTKTAALCQVIDEHQPLRRADAGPCNVAAMEPGDSAANVRHCTDTLNIDPDDVASLCIGVAGYSAVGRREQFVENLLKYYHSAVLEVVPDYVIAHSGAFPEGAGVIVIAGTGSAAFGVNPIGESAVVGGFGYLIDDAGTGYGLGRQVLAAAGRTFDGVPGAEKLTGLLKEKMGIGDREELIAAVYGGRLDRASIASLATLVTAAAADGDQYATSLLMHAGGALARVAQSAIHKIFGKNEVVQVARIGSLWRAGGELNSVFERSLLRSCTLAKIVEPAVSPVEGALSRALQMAADSAG